LLTITLRSIAAGARLHAKITAPRRRAIYRAGSRTRLRVRTPYPRRVVLHLSRDGVRSATVSVRVSRLRR